MLLTAVLTHKVCDRTTFISKLLLHGGKPVVPVTNKIMISVSESLFASVIYLIKPSNVFKIIAMLVNKLRLRTFGMVADLLDRTACNAEGTGSSVRDSYHAGTLSKFFSHNCSAIPFHLCR